MAHLERCFFLVTPRSGSTLLGDLLCVGKHPQKQSRLNPKHEDLAIETCCEFLYFLETGGLLPLTKAFRADTGAELVPRLQAADYRFIYLTRRNLLKQTLSGLQAGESGVWHKDKSDRYVETNIMVTEELLNKKALSMMRHNAIAEYFFQYYGIQPLRLYYEDHLESEALWDGLRDELEKYLSPAFLPSAYASFQWNPKPTREKIASDLRERFYQELILKGEHFGKDG